MTTPRTAARRTTSTIVSLVALAALLIGRADIARAQSGTAQISGIVHDQQGGVRPGVHATVRESGPEDRDRDREAGQWPRDRDVEQRAAIVHRRPQAYEGA